MPTGVYVRNETQKKQIRDMSAFGAELKRQRRLTAYFVDENGCWLWTKAQDGHGYGHVRVNGKSVKAYAFFYERKYGKAPKGLEFDHKCKVKLCVNPDHLEPVTHQVNCQRSIGKHLKNIPEILRLHRIGQPTIEISKKLKIPTRTICGIIKGERWSNFFRGKTCRV